MPVSIVCESATSLTTALRESLSNSYAGNGISNIESSINDVDLPVRNVGDDCLHNRLATAAKRVLLSRIDYEEINSYNQSVLDSFKSKYFVLKANPNVSSKPYDTENGLYSVYNSNIRTKADSNGNLINNNASSKITKRPNSNSSELPQPNRVLYPREDVRIGWKSSPRKWHVGVGMMNVGNTCYLNSTLQALFHVPSMANWLVSDTQHMFQCDSPDSCIICAMVKTLEASQSNQSAIRPYFVYSKLKFICKHLVMGRQEDAHEFLRYLVEAMEKSYLTRYRNYKELDQYSKETTPLNQILGGYLKSAVRCLSCGHISVTFQHFQDLLLDIRKAETIEDALEGYFARERLEDMGYKCESCRKKVSATKQFSLERAPITLCIQLKRFSVMGTKLNKLITIKPTLDLSKFASRKLQGEQLSYKLVAMVTHLGVSQHCGHYTAIGLTESGTYYNYDDSYVRPISLQSVCNTNAYIIFYEMDTNMQRSPCSMNLKRVNENFQKSEFNGTALKNFELYSQRIIGPQLPSIGQIDNATSHLNIPSAEPPLNNINTFCQTARSVKNNNNNKVIYQLKSGLTKCSSIYSKAASFTSPSATKKESSEEVLEDTSLLATNMRISETEHAHFTPAYEINEKQSINQSSPDYKHAGSSEDCVIGSTLNPTLPSMPNLFDNSNVESEFSICRKITSQAIEKKKVLSVPETLAVTLTRLVPYESETDDELSTMDSKCVMENRDKANDSVNNSLKSRNSLSFSTDIDKDNIQIENPGNAASKNNTTAEKNSCLVNDQNSLNISKNLNINMDKDVLQNCSIYNIFSLNKSQEPNHYKHHHKSKQKIENVQKRQKSNRFAATDLNGNKTISCNSLLNNDQNHNSPMTIFSTDNKMTQSNESNDNCGINGSFALTNKNSTTRSPFKRSQSTPPSPPVIKTKTGLWQVTTLQPLTGFISPPEQKKELSYSNPFSNRAVESSCKRKKSNLSCNSDKQNLFNKNGYQNNAMIDSAVCELSKQSHHGYGLSIPSWSEKQTQIEKEIIKEVCEQFQRQYDDQEEHEIDRGRQKKVKGYKKLESNKIHRTPAYNPFQEQENQQRWKKFSGGYVRRQFQRNKFKFQRFNHKLQRMTSCNYIRNGQNNYIRRNT